MVYLDEDKNLGRQVALMFLFGSFTSDELFKQRFRQKARPISQVLHPNIVEIHSMDEIDIVHRDIKPSNVLMRLNGKAKIADFGIAKALADSSAMSIEDTHSTTVFMGTPRFTPPEASDGVPANPSWDLYS